jgi:hypothetical protein
MTQAFNSPDNETLTVTLIGPVNASGNSWSMPISNICIYTAPGEMSPSSPLSDGAKRIGNSILSARISEDNVLRDEEGF